MTRVRVLLLPLACTMAACLLTACSSLRGARQPPSQPPAQPITAAAPSPPAPESGPVESSIDAKPPDLVIAPSCPCMEAKKKPKPKPKPKPVHVEAPPQLPTAPVVVETPPGGVIDAQVRPISVSVMSILGKQVRGPHGEDLGRVVDVLADATGRVRVAIVDFGGFLGVGNHRIAVDWPLLRFNPDGKDPSLLLSLSREQLKTAPEYKDNPRPQTLMEPSAPTASPSAAPAADAAPPPTATKK